MTIHGITFKVESKNNYFWFGANIDVCLESTDGFKWAIWKHAKDGAVLEYMEGTSRDVLVYKALVKEWFKQ